MIQLATERLTLRDHLPGDANDMDRLLSDPVAMRFLPDILTDGMAGTEENLQVALEEASNPKRTKWFFAILEKATGAYIGEIGYTVVLESDEGKVVNLGYFMLPAWWGKGIMTEAAQAVLRHAFTECGVVKVETGCLSENRGSEGVMRKLGMIREAELLKHSLHEGVLKDRVGYRLLKQEWLAMQAEQAEQDRVVQAVPREMQKAFRHPEKRPKMILFDFGQTLVDEYDFNAVRGTEAVLRTASFRPEGVTADTVQKLAESLLRDIGRRGVEPEAQNPIEVHNHVFNRYLYEALGVRFDQSPVEVERIFWDAASPSRPTPGVANFLAYLASSGIRTGVISNISFSGEALEARIARHFPGYPFEFVLASSEYAFRKPHRRLFDIALRKGGLDAADAWYCGDHAVFDVEGSSASGLFPVWYKAVRHAHDVAAPGADERLPRVPCLNIRDWRELQGILASLPS